MKYSLFVVLLLIPAALVKAEAADEYVLQVLEPTGGKLLRPATWHFEERHRSINSLAWVISKEHFENGSYDTGLSIQFMIGIQKSSGQPLEKTMRKTLESAAKNGKEISRCEPEKMGFFTRQCLEVVEKQTRDGVDVMFHVQYSFFWNADMDMAAVTVAGAPVELWDENKEIFKRMSEIEIIDVSKFSSK